MNVKKIALAVVALGMSSVAFAGTYAPAACTSHAVSIPCEDSAWDVGFELFWVDATTDNQNYASSVNATVNDISYHRVGADYKFGFELTGSLHFATGNDFTVRWERAHNDQSDSFEAHNASGSNVDKTTLLTGYLVADSAFFGSDNLGVKNETTVTAKQAYEFDVINAEFGQHIDVGNDMDLRVHAGLQYARIEYTKSLRFSTEPSESVTRDNLLEMESEINALGARVGADAAYSLGNGFSLVGHSSLSLLAGDVTSELRALDDSAAAGTLASKQVIKADNDMQVIPAVMLKSGVNYASDLFDGHMSFEGGWRWEGYFQSMRFVADPVGATENFTFSGPYVAVYYVS